MALQSFFQKVVEFFLFKNYGIFGMKIENAPKWVLAKKWLKIKPRVRQLLTPKKFMVYYRLNSHKIVWFGIFWLDYPKYHLWGILSTQFLSKNTNFILEFKIIEKKEFWNSLSSYMLSSKVIFKTLYFSIILNSKMEFVFFDKIFQIRQLCASLCDNKPWPFLALKAA